jgi:hypothetical protein
MTVEEVMLLVEKGIKRTSNPEPAKAPLVPSPILNIPIPWSLTYN